MKQCRVRENRIFKAVTFDLFGTIVQLDEGRLPQIEVDGILLPSLLASSLNRLREMVPAVNLGDALVAYAQVVSEFREQAHIDSDREAPAHSLISRCLARIGIVDDALARALAQSQMETTIEAAKPTAGAVRLLTLLRKRGYSLGLVSNLSDAGSGYELLSRLDMTKYFNAIVFSGDVGWRKPNKRIFEAALTALDVDASKVLHIGDELRADVWGAGRCGLSTVWVNTNEIEFEGDHPPRMQINRLTALAECALICPCKR